jgi:hypothetical protein
MIHQGYKDEIEAGPDCPVTARMRCPHCVTSNWFMCDDLMTLIAKPTIKCWSCGETFITAFREQ